MLTAGVRNGVVLMVRLGTFWGLVAFCAGCQRQHPLKDEFSQVVLRRQSQAADLPGTGDEEAFRGFVRRHGRDAVPMYRAVISAVRHPEGVAEELELLAAVEGIVEVEGASALPVLRELVVDLKVPFWTIQNGLAGLKAGAREGVVEAVGERLLRETDVQQRVDLVAYLLKAAHPAAIPILQGAASREPDASLRGEMELSVLLLQSPGTCRRIQKQFLGDELARKWFCGYRCSGARQGYYAEFKEECADVIAVPQEKRKKGVGLGAADAQVLPADGGSSTVKDAN